MESVVEIDVKTCYHCGEGCKEEVILHHDHTFCCQGCQTVYDILSENELGDFYNLGDRPGFSPKNTQFGHKYEFLDDAKLTKSLLEFQDGAFSKITFQIPQIHCSSCIWLLENLYKLNTGIHSSRVNFVKREATVVFEHNTISLKGIVQLLAKIGYEPSFTLDNESPKEDIHKKVSKKLYYQMGIAGFAFGNIMLFSLPEYFGLEGQFTHSFAQVFGFLNIILSLPVLLYSDLDYFKSAWTGLRNKTVNLDVPISLGILALFGVSIYEILSQTGAGYLDTFAGLIFFLLLGKNFQQKTYQKLSFERDYKSYFPISVTTVSKTGEENSVPVNNLKKGDRIMVRNQELVPADAILLQGEAMIDYSFVTGESTPVSKVYGEIIFAGGRQIGGAIELEVIKEVSQSYLTSLWNNETFSKHKDNELTLLVNKNSKYFTAVVLTIATIAAIYWTYTLGIGVGVKVFSSVLIIACPCALALSTPFTLGNTIRIFGNNHFYLKNSAVVEAIASSDVIVFDKTGTLTETSQAEIGFNGRHLIEDEWVAIKSVIRFSTHPLSKKTYNALIFDVKDVKNFQEHIGKGVEGIVNDLSIKVGSAAFLSNLKNDFEISQASVFVAINDEVVGYYVFQHEFRDGLRDVINKLAERFKFYVLSGDNDRELPRLRQIFGQQSEMKFTQSPQDKLTFVENLQVSGKQVIMIGDGLNDAGALRKSDVGIAIADDVTAFSPACDAILAAGVFHKLDKYIDFSKTSVKIIKSCFVISFLYNVVGLTVTVTGHLSPVFAAIVMPLSSITIVVYTYLATNFFARKHGVNNS